MPISRSATRAAGGFANNRREGPLAPAWVADITPGTWAQIATNTIREVDPGWPRTAYNIASTISSYSGGLGYYPTVGTSGTYCLGLSGGHASNSDDIIYAFDLATAAWSLLKPPADGDIDTDIGYKAHYTTHGNHYYQYLASSSATGKIVQTRGMYDDVYGMPYPALYDVAAAKVNYATAGTLCSRLDQWNVYGGWPNNYDDFSFEDYNPSPPNGRSPRNRIMIYGHTWGWDYQAFSSHPVFRPSGSTWTQPSGWESIDSDGPYFGGIWALDPTTGNSTQFLDYGNSVYPVGFAGFAGQALANAALDTERDVWGWYWNGTLSLADPERPTTGYTNGSAPSGKQSYNKGAYWTATTSGTAPTVNDFYTLLYSKRLGGFIVWSATGSANASHNNVYLAEFTGTAGWDGGDLTTGSQPGSSAQYTWSNLKETGGTDMTSAIGLVHSTWSGYGLYNKARLCRFSNGEEVLLFCNSAGYNTATLDEVGPAVYAFRLP